jgi:hypothetical protein
VEIWSQGYARLERVLSRCARVDIARGAYKAALVTFPDKFITLRDGIRVVEKSHPDA